MNKAKYLTKPKLTQAFSLIELMVVVAIIALLTAIAVPSYKTYLQQAAVTQIFGLASDLMTQQQKNQDLAYKLSGSTSPSTLVNNPVPAVLSTEIVDSGATPSSSFLSSAPGYATTSNASTNGGTGGVAITLSGTRDTTTAGTATAIIDPSMGGQKIAFIPYYQANQSGDMSDRTIEWMCFYGTSGVSAGDQTTLLSLLGTSSGMNCTASGLF